MQQIILDISTSLILRGERDMKKLRLVLGVLLVFAIVLSACQKAAEPTPVAEEGEAAHRVAMVLPGLKTDEAFNEYYVRVMEEYALTLSEIEQVVNDETHKLHEDIAYSEVFHDAVVKEIGLCRTCEGE